MLGSFVLRGVGPPGLGASGGAAGGTSSCLRYEYNDMEFVEPLRFLITGELSSLFFNSNN